MEGIDYLLNLGPLTLGVWMEKKAGQGCSIYSSLMPGIDLSITVNGGLFSGLYRKQPSLMSKPAAF